MSDWPGLMKRTTAARYCELTLAKFERAVMNGELPLPVKINGEERWYRHEIDAINQPANDVGMNGWRKRSPLYAKG